MAFTKKIAGWVAGRIKGEQARKDTMRWMEKTGLGQILDIAGDIALTQGAIKGAGKLKGLFTGGPSAPAATTAAKALPEGVTEVGRLASASPAESRALVGQMTAPAAPQAPMRAMVAPGATPGPVTPQIRMPQMPTSLPPAGGGAPTPIASQVSAGLGQRPPQTPFGRLVGAVKSGASATMQYGRENAPLIAATAPAVANVIGAKIEQDIEEEKIKREQAARNRLAMLLMPMFQAQMGQAAPSFQPRG